MLQQVDQINLPGTTDPVYACWQRKLTLPLEELFLDSRVKQIASLIAAERPHVVTPEILAEAASKKKRAKLFSSHSPRHISVSVQQAIPV